MRFQRPGVNDTKMIVFKPRISVIITNLVLQGAMYWLLYDFGGLRCVGVVVSTSLAVYVVGLINTSLQAGEPQ